MTILPFPVHSLIVGLILSTDDLLPPVAAGQVPVDRLLDAIGKFRLWQPTELVVYLRRIDGIAHIVSLAVGHEGDQALISSTDRRRTPGCRNRCEKVIIGMQDHIHQMILRPHIHVLIRADPRIPFRQYRTTHAALDDQRTDASLFQFSINPTETPSPAVFAGQLVF